MQGADPLRGTPPNLPLGRVEQEPDQPVERILVVPSLSRDPHQCTNNQ